MAESGPTVHQVPDVLNVPEPNEQTVADWLLKPGGHLDLDDDTWSLAAYGDANNVYRKVAS